MRQIILYPVQLAVLAFLSISAGLFFLGCEETSSETSVSDRAVSVADISPETITLSGEMEGISWAKAIGNGDSQYVSAITTTSDNGFIAAGHTRKDKNSADDVWVVKLDSNLNVLWSKAYSGGVNEYAYALTTTSDGCVVFAGEKRFYNINDDLNLTSSYKYDTYIVKLDMDGNIVWEKAYGGDDYDCANDIMETPDGGFIVAGYSQSYGASYTPEPHAKKDLWIYKLDSQGEMVWQCLFGEENGSDNAYSVAVADDGGYMAAGFTSSYGAGGYDGLLLKVDPEGTVEWSRTFGGPKTDMIRAIHKTDDGGFILAGETSSKGNGQTDLYILKTDSSGNLIWEKTIGGEKFDRAFDVKVLDDQTILVSGYTSSSGAGSNDFFLIQLGTDGSLLQENTFGGFSYDQLNALCPMADGSIIASGPTSSYGYGDIDMFLIKIFL